MTETGRLEAFSDGVLAIAITLLVLDLKVPPRNELHGESLGRALAHQWPNYFAYVVSFLVIGIIWVNHHAMFVMVARADRWVLFANLLLLLAVAAIPFPTRLLAEYLTAGGRDAHVAAAVYSATMLAMGIAFATLWLTLARRPGFLRVELTRDEARRSFRRFGAGIVAYAVTVVISFVSAPLTLLVHGVLALYYCFDQLAADGRVVRRT
jgi:uncharacterized membrane protein